MRLGIRFLKTAAIALTMAAVAPLPGYAQKPGDGKSVQPIMSGITGHVFQHEIVRLALEKLGYNVKPALEADYPALHLSIAQGQADYTANHWIPVHNSFYEKSGGDQTMVRLGVYIAAAGQGYFIDKSTADKYKITSLEQFKDPAIAKLFDMDGDGKANLMGCNPGWGCEKEIEHHLDAYKLRGSINHNQGSYFALMADTITRYEAKKPIFYYTWTPQWVGSVLVPGRDVVQLNVPFSASTDGSNTALPDGTNPGFKTNDIVILANKQFIAKNPVAKKLFEVINIPLADVNEAILLAHRGANSPAQITQQAKDWVAKHQAQFDGWIKAAETAQR